MHNRCMQTMWPIAISSCLFGSSMWQQHQQKSICMDLGIQAMYICADIWHVSSQQSSRCSSIEASCRMQLLWLSRRATTRSSTKAPVLVSTFPDIHVFGVAAIECKDANGDAHQLRLVTGIAVGCHKAGRRLVAQITSCKLVNSLRYYILYLTY